MSSENKGIAGAMLPKCLPDDAVPFSAMNAAAITTTTKQTIKAGVTGKRMFICQASAVNLTAAEVTLLALRQGTTDFAVLVPDDGSDANPAKGPVRFDPPLVVPAGVDLDGISMIAAVGDCHISVSGYVGT
jgi:hypothetical protein